MQQLLAAPGLTRPAGRWLRAVADELIYSVVKQPLACSAEVFLTCRRNYIVFSRSTWRRCFPLPPPLGSGQFHPVTSLTPWRSRAAGMSTGLQLCGPTYRELTLRWPRGGWRERPAPGELELVWEGALVQGCWAPSPQASSLGRVRVPVSLAQLAEDSRLPTKLAEKAVSHSPRQQKATLAWCVSRSRLGAVIEILWLQSQKPGRWLWLSGVEVFLGRLWPIISFKEPLKAFYMCSTVDGLSLKYCCFKSKQYEFNEFKNK